MSAQASKLCLVLILISVWIASPPRGEIVCRILLTGWFMSANTEAQGSGRGLEAMKWIIVADVYKRQAQRCVELTGTNEP